MTSAIFWSGVWFALSVTFNLQGSLLPDIRQVVPAAFALATNVTFLQHLGVTFARIVPSIVLAVFVGVPLGIAIAASPLTRRMFLPVLDFFRGVPVAMLFPVAIILFGIGEYARAVLSAYVAIPIVITATVSGALERPENRGRRQYLRLHRPHLPRLHEWMCSLWDALPSILGGIKVAISLSLVVVIVSEMFFVGGTGVGYYAWEQYQAFQIPQMYAAILIIGLISFGLNTVFDQLARRVSGAS